MQSVVSIEHSVLKRGSLVNETVEGGHSQELTVLSSTTAETGEATSGTDGETAGKGGGTTVTEGEKAGTEETTTSEQAHYQHRKKKAAASGSSNTGGVSCRDRLRKAMTLSGWQRKTYEKVVLAIAVVISLGIASVPPVLYFTLAVSTIQLHA